MRRLLCALALVGLLATPAAAQQVTSTVISSPSEPVCNFVGAVWIDVSSTPTIKICTATNPATWASLVGGEQSAHTHPISDVVTLQAVLNAKAALAHNHAIGDVSSLQAALDAKAAALHAHIINDVTGLQAALDAKAAAAHNYALADVTNLVSTLAGKAATSHTHPQSEVTNLSTDLAGKAAVTHAHAGADITSGTVAAARLGSGTPDSTTFLRGDNTWAAPPAGQGGSGATVLRVTADVSQSTTTFSNVTGLTHAVNAGQTYTFECLMSYTSAATTTALQLSVNGPAMTALDYDVFTATTATASHFASQTAVDTVVNPATGGGATRLPVRVSGSFIPSAAGTFAIRYRSEVNASAVTIKRGSFCQIQ